MSLLRQALNGSMDVLTARQWTHRIVGLILLAIMSAPLVVFVRAFDGSLAQVVFIGGYLLMYAGLLGLGVGLWRPRYAALLARWQRTPVLLLSLIVPWLALVIYEFLLLRRPIDLLFIFNLAALVWSLMVVVAIPNLNLAKAASFTIVFLICLMLITPAFVSYSHTIFSRWIQFDDLPDNSLDVIYVGNSHAFYAFQPRVIDDLLGIHSYTLGTSSSETKIVYEQLREALLSQTPDVVVFETLPLEVDDAPLAMREFGYLLPLHGVPAVEATFNLFSPAEYQYAIMPLLYFHTNWQEGPLSVLKRGAVAMAYETLSMIHVDPNTVIHALGLNEGETSDEQGALLTAITVAPEDYGTQVQQRAISDVNRDYFDRIVRMCEAAGVELVLVRAPILDKAVIAPPPFADLAASYGLDYHDYNDFEFNRINFYDKRHVNILGGLRTSFYTAQVLSDKLGIPFDETAYTQYQAILVKDLAVTLDGDMLTYRLLMVDDSPDAEFRWHVTDAQGNVLADEDFAPQPSVTFPLPAEGDYQIALEIRNRVNPALNASALLTERYDPSWQELASN